VPSEEHLLNSSARRAANFVVAARLMPLTRTQTVLG
jgi:hypothetical protein